MPTSRSRATAKRSTAPACAVALRSSGGGGIPAPGSHPSPVNAVLRAASATLGERLPLPHGMAREGPVEPHHDVERVAGWLLAEATAGRGDVDLTPGRYDVHRGESVGVLTSARVDHDAAGARAGRKCEASPRRRVSPRRCRRRSPLSYPGPASPSSGRATQPLAVTERRRRAPGRVAKLSGRAGLDVIAEVVGMMGTSPNAEQPPPWKRVRSKPAIWCRSRCSRRRTRPRRGSSAAPTTTSRTAPSLPGSCCRRCRRFPGRRGPCRCRQTRWPTARAGRRVSSGGSDGRDADASAAARRPRIRVTRKAVTAEQPSWSAHRGDYPAHHVGRSLWLILIKMVVFSKSAQSVATL